MQAQQINNTFSQPAFQQELKEASQQHNVIVTAENRDAFSQPEFKSELKQAADAHMDTAGYLWEEHKGVARDAAAMAASKAADFAKAAEGESELTSEKMDQELVMLKDKAVETLVSAKATLEVAKDAVVMVFEEAKEVSKEAYDMTVQSVSHAYDVSKERTVQAYGWTADKIEGVIEEAKEKTSEALEFIGEKMKLTGDNLIDRAETIAPSTIGQPMPSGPLSSTDFKQELQEAACEHSQTAGFQWEAHKDVARDAAAMALSKSADFAKCAENDFQLPSEEGYIDMAKERITETLDMAKEKGMAAYGWTGGKLEGAVLEVKEKTGEALEYLGDRMKGAGGAMYEKGLEASNKGLELQHIAAAPAAMI